MCGVRTAKTGMDRRGDGGADHRPRVPDEFLGHGPIRSAKVPPSLGPLFPLASAFLGWVAVMLSGSDTSGNALFGNLQVVAAHQLNLNPVLFAATNSSGGVMGKMISPQKHRDGRYRGPTSRARRAACSRAPSSTASS